MPRIPIRRMKPPKQEVEAMLRYWDEVSDPKWYEARQVFGSLKRIAEEASGLRSNINGLSERLDAVHQDMKKLLTDEHIALLKEHGYPVEQREHGTVINGNVYLDDYLKLLVKPPVLREELARLGVPDDRHMSLNMSMLVSYLFEHQEPLSILLEKKFVEAAKRVTVRPDQKG